MAAERSPAASAQAWYLEPSWIVLAGDDQADLLSVPDGTTVTLPAALWEAAVADPGELPATLRTMADVSPDAARLVEALRDHRPEPLDRARLLRGSGYRQLFVELTARCNERCVHCYAESSPHRTEELDEAVVNQVLEDGRELGFSTVQLTGGDPLISPLCAGAARKARDLGFETIEVYTNGVALDDGLYGALREVDACFAFSFYSHDPATHDAVTQTPGSHERTMRAIRRVLADGVSFRVNMIVVEANREHLRQTVAFLKDNGVSPEVIGMSPERSVGRGGVTGMPDVEVQIGPPVHKLSDGWPFRGMATVAYDGKVYPCIFSRMFTLGNVYEARLKDILRAPIEIDLPSLTRVVEHQTWGERLSCWECQVRATLLSSVSSSASSADGPSVQLRRKH